MITIRRFPLASVLVICAVFARWSPCRAADFEPIFDGRTLAGWKCVDMTFWSVEDGAITGTISQQHAPTTNQYLVWQGDELHDFELKLRFRLTGSDTPVTNGGFQFRSQLLPDHDVAGYQVDNNFGQPWKVRLYDEHGRHTLAFQGKRTEINASGRMTTTDLPKDPAAGAFRLDDWHEYHLICQGSHLLLKVNGHTVAEVFDNDPKQQDFSGILALQLHTGPTMKAQFKDIRLKRLRAGK